MGVVRAARYPSNDPAMKEEGSLRGEARVSNVVERKSRRVRRVAFGNRVKRSG